MKNKKSLLGLVLLLLVAILGVGYAVVNNTELTIGGSASVPTEDLKVVFDTTKAVDVSSEKISGTITDTKTATIKVENLMFGETHTAKYTIKNEEGNLSANLSTKSIEVSNNEYFDVTISYDKTTLAAGESTKATVTVTLKKTPISTEDSTTDINIAITATPAA